jgi:two-component system sensor histidine kinase PilS (NtrC family)
MFRIVATTLMLGVLAVRLMHRQQLAELGLEDTLSFAVLGGAYVINLVHGILLRLGWTGRAAAYIQVAGDVAIATSLVYLTGGVESPFTVVYALAVVSASALLSGPGVLVTTVSSALALVVLGVCINQQLLRPPQGSTILTPPALVFVLSANVLAQALIAVLATNLSRQLSQAGGELYAREEDLRRLDKLQAQILEHMPSGLLTCEKQGRVTFINRAGVGILGLSSEREWLGTPVEGHLPDLREVADGRRHELEFESQAGPRVLGLTATSLDEPGSLLVVFQDLTDLRRAQRELERVDRLAALGKFSAQLAHEIRNPLAAMRGSAQMLLADEAASPSAARLSKILVREADRLGHLVDDFLRFARPTEPKRMSTGLKALVQDTLEMLQQDPLSRMGRLTLDLEDVWALADPDQLRQALLNLLRNAFEAAGTEGSVRVTLRGQGTPQAELRVWDSAGSIPAGDLQRVFEPFFTTRSSGTGLGLSTTLAIVRAHGGSLDVRSSPETGTEFTVTLPGVAGEAVLARSGGG